MCRKAPPADTGRPQVRPLPAAPAPGTRGKCGRHHPSARESPRVRRACLSTRACRGQAQLPRCEPPWPQGRRPLWRGDPLTRRRRQVRHRLDDPGRPCASGPSRRRIFWLDVADIAWIQVASQYCRVHAASGESLLSRSLVREIRGSGDGGHLLLLHDGQAVPMGRARREVGRRLVEAVKKAAARRPPRSYHTILQTGFFRSPPWPARRRSDRGRRRSAGRCCRCPWCRRRR